MNKQQKDILDKIKIGRNVFISGVAGTGKTYTINNITDWAKATEKNVGITASTGISALLINGKTIHSFLGLGLGKKTVKELVVNINKKIFIKRRILFLELLIIDEISMLGLSLFEKIDQILSSIRNNSRPFGGIQVVFCGDFAQLPPVNDKYCFLSPVWKSLTLESVYLTKNYRQIEDQPFQDILNRLRWGICSQEDLDILLDTYHNSFSDIKPTILYTKNINVQTLNEQKMKELNQEIIVYKNIFSSEKSKFIAKTQNIDETVSLCLGAQVILTRNIDLEIGLVNGSRGIITKIEKERVKVKFKIGEHWISFVKNDLSDKENMSIWCSYLPLKLAYALTIHKSQGMTIDCLEVDLSDTFEYGQAYTAISRAKNLKSIKIINVRTNCFKTHPQVIEFYKIFSSLY